jgi:hypothetical protein
MTLLGELTVIGFRTLKVVDTQKPLISTDGLSDLSVSKKSRKFENELLRHNLPPLYLITMFTARGSFHPSVRIEITSYGLNLCVRSQLRNSIMGSSVKPISNGILKK